MRRTGEQRGAVSLFVVIFSALLITTITVAFVRIMLQDQMQATTNDLAKSALDSAYAGVEDAKRAIVTYRAHCVGSGSDSGTPECVNLERALEDGSRCDTIQQSGIAGTPGDKEVLVKRTESDTADELLQQAYTCVKVQLNTVDYVGSLTPNTSRLIALKSEEPFDQITLEWYSQEDLQTDLSQGEAGEKVNLSTDAKLPKLAEWPKNRPALMRVQLLQYGSHFNLSDFDKNDGEDTNNASLFLVPSNVGLDKVSFADDLRQSHLSDSLEQIRCDENFTATSADTQYACKVTITLPRPIGSSDNTDRHAFLRVNEFYNTNTRFRVTMENGADDPVLFTAVQPVVDSTGRANDLFRRIRSRIELEASSIPSVEAVADVSGSLCKTFLVTDQKIDYSPGNCLDL